ncbi:Zinc finger C2H2-type protein [Macrophomina phaseolina MS6]|uniref:Zinc finger C2H2-type protein n=1 Tax=Macrophomina phaseolina (strain MS6) TaxID=1126212 RepID=K2RXD0_MACPH|nr:Zinc finger C2H2-type protein [Macrophomina phaseolina MS6]
MPHARKDRQNSGSRQGSSQRENSPKPATKADAARKRNFSEIVDLTQLSDDEEPPQKKQPDSSHDIAPTWAASPDPVFYTRPTGPSNLYTLPTLIHADDKIKNMDVVQPLNRKYALRRSTYEVKTIARDVLLATGKHPEMRPLNGHLDILRESFKKVDNTSDLSTLRWDLIDPGDPPQEALKSEVIDIEDEDADDEEDAPEEPDRPRPPQSVPGPAQLSSASRAGLHAVPPPSLPPPALHAPLSGPKRRGRPSKQSLSGETGARASRALQSSNRERRYERTSSSNIGTPTTQSPMFNNKPLGYSAFRATQYAPDGTPLPKKKGRPVGWRKSIHSKEAQAQAAGLTPQPASASRPSGLHTSQPPGGVVVVHSRSPSIGSSIRAPPSYSVYKCQWEHCAAELHNMETLRKHVFKFHTGQNAHKKWPCYWAGCGENERSIDPRTGKANGFSVLDDFKDHVEFAHLGPKSWELGDGHAGGLSESHDSASEAYLSDSRGRMVTPLIARPSREAIKNAVEAAVPAPRKPGRPKEKSENQKAQEAQAGLEQKKRLIGPGLDRGGVRLANEKRRMGFLDDEDFEEVVSDSE